MNNRSYFWDNFKGILIFLVVLGHFLYSYAINMDGHYIEHIFIFIYMFHMPAFIFCSGYMSKSEKSRSARSITTLFLYYLVFNSMMMVFAPIYTGAEIKLLTPYYSYWYLLSLIFWRLSVGGLSKIKGIVPFTVIITLLLGFSSEFSNILSIRRTVGFFLFFLLGYLFKKEYFQKFMASRSRRLLKLGIFIGFLGTAAAFRILKVYNITLEMTMAGSYESLTDIGIRVFIIGFACIAIFVLMLVLPDRKIPFITTIGKNSLLIYLLHRFPTLIYAQKFPYSEYTEIHMLYVLVGTIVTCLLLGNEWLNRMVAGLFHKAVGAMFDKNSRIGHMLKTGILICIVIMFCVPAAFQETTIFENVNGNKVIEKRVLNKEQEKAIDNAVCINYVGDLILLKDQVTTAYNGESGKYEFDKMFQYAKPYFENAELSFGVFEGPAAGDEAGYSSSNYGDGLPLYLNFPDSFAQAIKDAGIDVVSTANNHLLDKELDGALRTLDVLDQVGLKHTGSYRNQKEKDDLLIVEADGIKIAVLSYLKGVNYYKTNEIYEEMPYLTSIIPTDSDEYYQEFYKEIKVDFEQAKSSEADLVLVMAHMGTQFSNTTDEFQDKWNRIFADLGADIIFGDHAHAVQPIEYVGETLVVNCPGNFANSYIGNYGDATAMVEVYIDKDTKKVIATGVVPMYTHEVEPGYFIALPIYDIMLNEDLYLGMSAVEKERVKSVQNLVTEVMLKEPVSLDDVQQRYFFIDNQFYKNRRTLLKSADEYEDTELYQLIKNADSISFIGDSITEGTKNDFHPWYEPMMEDFAGKEVTNIAKGSYTTKRILRDYSDAILKSNDDLYIIAIGTNDVRYRHKNNCAMDAKAYVHEMNHIISLIKESNTDAKVVILSPWTTCVGDTVSRLNHEQKETMIDEYAQAAAEYARENGFCFIDQNPYLREFYETHYYKLYAKDAIHPIPGIGVELYSKAVLESSKKVNE